MVQSKSFNLYSARTAGMLSGARRVAMLLVTLLLTMTAQTAWAEDVIYCLFDRTTSVKTIKYGDYDAVAINNTYEENVWKAKYDPSTVGSDWGWNSNAKTIIVDESCKNYNGTSLKSFFSHFGNSNDPASITGITGLEYLNYHNTVTDMQEMFYEVKKLTTLDCSGLNTTNVTYMTLMFRGCEALTELDLSSFNTANVKYTSFMFQNCYALQTIIVNTNWDISSVTGTNSNNMFGNCNALVGEQGSTYDSGILNKTYARIDGGTSNPGYLTGRYTITYNTNGGTMPTDPYVTTFTGKDNVVITLPMPTLEGQAFAGWCEDSELTGTARTSYPAGTTGDKTLYAKWTKALYAIISGTNMTLKCGDPSSEAGAIVFDGTSTWNSGFNGDITTAIVDASCQNYTGTTLNSLFNECINLTTITGLDNLNTDNVTDMGFVFSWCQKLTSVDVSKFNTSNVTNMSYLFNYCEALTTLDVSSFNTAKVTDMTGLFNYCENLTTIDIRNFNTGEVKYMDYMFDGCHLLKTIIVGEGWSTAKVTLRDDMFENSNQLVGQNGTTCDGINNIDVTYARVDAAGTPGYLSLGLNEATGIISATAFAGKKAQFSRTFTSGVASTICLPFPMTSIPGGTAYEFTAMEKVSNVWTATMSAVTSTEAGKPYLFKASADGAVIFSGTVPSDFTGVAASSDPVQYSEGGTWTFRGTYTKLTYGTNLDGAVYGFAGAAYSSISAGDFVKAETGAYVSPFRCYLTYNAPSSARGMTRGADIELPSRIIVRLVDSNGQTTAIGSMDTKTGEVSFDSDAWYSLDGRKLNGKPTKKGMYINNGRKMIIK